RPAPLDGQADEVVPGLAGGGREVHDSAALARGDPAERDPDHEAVDALVGDDQVRAASEHPEAEPPPAGPVERVLHRRLVARLDEVPRGAPDAERRERRQGHVAGDDHRPAGTPVTPGSGWSPTWPVATAAPCPRVAAAFTHPARFNRPRLGVLARGATGGVAGSLARVRPSASEGPAAARDPSPDTPTPPPPRALRRRRRREPPRPAGAPRSPR